MSSIFFDALLWPVYNISKALQLQLPGSNIPGNEKCLDQPVPSYLDLVGHLAVICGAIRAYMMSCVVIYVISPIVQPLGIYPALGEALLLDSAWMTPIILRNIFATWVICGCWDWFLYFSPLKERLTPFKINPVYPPISQLWHDALWTTCASLVASVLEIMYCYCVCNKLLYYPPPDQLIFSWTNILWILLVTHWRIPHFYIIHRLMHPWRVRVNSVIPDIGKVLYKHVHSIHHKSHNPTAFSGTSMHPLEALLYYSAAGIAVCCGKHCTIVLACVIDCAVGAWLGHDGFRFPGSGDEFHQLHHAHFDCNYGTSIDSIDCWMGTAVSRKSDLKKLK